MYEVGDKVIYQGADKNAYKKVGVLKSIEEKDGKPQLTVEFEGGETFTAPIDDWSRKFNNAATHVSTNSVVRNAMVANRRMARNAYCEAGDYIETKDGGQDTVKRVVGDKVYLKSGDVISMSDVKAVLNAKRVARNAKFNPYSSDKDFGNGIECLVEDKNGVIKTSVRAGHGGSYVTGSAAEIKSWMRSEEAKLKAIFDAVNKAVAFASKWDGKPTESYDA